MEFRKTKIEKLRVNPRRNDPRFLRKIYAIRHHNSESIFKWMRFFIASIVRAYIPVNNVVTTKWRYIAFSTKEILWTLKPACSLPYIVSNPQYYTTLYRICGLLLSPPVFQRYRCDLQAASSYRLNSWKVKSFSLVWKYVDCCFFATFLSWCTCTGIGIFEKINVQRAFQVENGKKCLL